MSKPRELWWSYAKAMIRNYARLADRRRDLQAMTPPRDLSGAQKREHDAVAKAIDITGELPGGKERLLIVKLVLMDGSHNIAGAALQANCSEQTAKNYHKAFIRLVGECRGLK